MPAQLTGAEKNVYTKKAKCRAPAKSALMKCGLCFFARESEKGCGQAQPGAAAILQ